VQPLDLEERVSDQERSPDNAFGPPARGVDVAGKGGEVQRRLLYAAVSKELEPAGDEELRQPVRRIPVAAHERERDDWAAVARREVQETADVVVGVPAEHHEAVAVVLPPEVVEGHRETALDPALPPASADCLDLYEVCVGELRELVQPGRVPLFL